MAIPRVEENTVAAEGIDSSHSSVSLHNPARPPRVLVDEPARGWIREIGDVLRDLVAHHELIYYMVLRDVKIRYKQAAMGFAWALLMPLMIVGAGFVIQLVLARGSGQPVSRTALAGTAVKSLPWAFFVGSIQFATNSLTTNSNLVSKVFFPREVLPVGAVVAQAFDSGIGALALIVVLPFVGFRPTLGLLWLPVIMVLLFMFTLAASIFLACANLFYRDVKYVVQILLTFGIFFTPVLFEPAMLGSRGAKLIMLNPLAIILEAFRLSMVQGHNLLQPLEVVRSGAHVIAWAPWYLSYAAAFAVLGLAAALLMFRRLQFLFAEFI